MEDMDSASDDPTVSSLLAMSEYYLSQAPQRIKEAIKCLMAALSLKPPPRIEARTRLKLGLLFYHHTNNLHEARAQLDQAQLVTQSAANLEEIRFEATSVNTRILVEQRALPQAKSLLRSKLDNSTRYPYWHIRLLLQLADIHVCERDERGVVSVLDRCAEFARQVDASYARLLCMLYKGAFLLTHQRYQEAGEVLNQTSSVMEGYHGDKENLVRTFYLVIQVSHLLMAGQVKTAKPHLKQLQQRVKQLSSESSTSEQAHGGDGRDGERLTADSIQWLTREQTFVIVYLVSVMYSVMSGYTDKALTYADKAFQFMNASPNQKNDSSGVVAVLRAHLLEHTITCLLMQGKPSSVTDKLEEVVTVCHNHPQLVFSHRAVLHVLLGLYAFATDRLDRAIVQFHTALQHTNNSDLRLFITVNLAISYMKEGEKHRSELTALMQMLDSDLSAPSCLSLKAAIHYVKGLYSYSELKLHDAKRQLRETLVMSNKCDLNKLTACSLILLGQIFLSVGNTKETMDMVSPAMQLAQKIPDKKLQVWAATLLADLYHLTGQPDKEAASREQCREVEKTLTADQAAASHSKHNSLLQWTVGDWPVAKPSPSKLLPPPDGPHPHGTTLSSPTHVDLTNTPQPNMLTQHPSQGHTSSLKRPADEDDVMHRRHPIAEPTTPTHSSKSRKIDHKLKSEKGSKYTNSPSQQHNGPQPKSFSPSGRKHAHPKNLEITTDGDQAKIARRNSVTTPTHFGILTKSPEVRLNKVTTPTRQTPRPLSPSNNGEKGVSHLRTANREHEGMDSNNLWADSSTSAQSQDRNFLPSFDSDMAFQQLSLSPPLRHAKKTQAQHQQPHPQQPPQQQRHQEGRHDAQRGGQARNSPQVRPPPPSYHRSPVSGESPYSSQNRFSQSGPSPAGNPHQPSNVHALANQREKIQRLQDSPMTAHQQRGVVDQFSLRQELGNSQSIEVEQYRSLQGERRRDLTDKPLYNPSAGSGSQQDQRMSHSSQRSGRADVRNPAAGGFNPTGIEVQDQALEQMSESLSIPTLHDLHSQQSQEAPVETPSQQYHHHQRQRNAQSPLGIPPFHQIQMHKSTSSGSIDLSTSPNAQMLSSMQQSSRNSPSSQILQVGANLSPRANTSVLHQAQPQSQQRVAMGSPQRQHQLQGSSGGSGSNVSSPRLQTHTPPPGGHLSPLLQPPQSAASVGGSSSNISPLHQQALHGHGGVGVGVGSSPLLPPMQQLMQQRQHFQQQIGSQGTGGGAQQLQQDMVQQRHQVQQHNRAFNQQESVLSQLQTSSAQFPSALRHQQHQQQPGGGQFSPQKVLSLSPQSHHHHHQQQQQQMLQLQQAQRQFLFQQQQQKLAGAGVVQNHAFLPGSAMQPYFAAASSSAMANASNKQLAVTHPQISHPQLTHPQFTHPQLTHLPALHPIGHDAGGGNVLNQQQPRQLIMGGNPYASFGQGVQLLPNGTAAIPRAGAGFQLPGQTMGSPLRHYHSQGR